MNGEIKMITDVAKIAPTELAFNYDELKAYLATELEQYRTMVVTEEAMTEAKESRAKLNKLAKHLDDYRLGVKKLLMAQYEEDFAPKMNELKGMAVEASACIDEQIKAFEERDKKQKIEALHAQYEDLADAELTLYCPWEYIYNPKWENKTYKADDAISEIKMAFETTKRAIKTIREMGGNDAAYLLNFYKETHDLASCMQKMNDLKTTREREAQRQQEEAAQIPQTAETSKKQSEDAPNNIPESVTEPLPIRTVDFRVWANDAQLASLAVFMRGNGIKYGRVPEKE